MRQYTLLVSLVLFNLSSGGGDHFDWHGLEIVFPHPGAEVAFQIVPAEILVEVTLESDLKADEASYLPRDVTSNEDVGRFVLDVTLDGERVETFDIGNRSYGWLRTHCSAINSVKPIEPEADHSHHPRLLELETARSDAFAAFLGANPEASDLPRLFDRWTRLADELADAPSARTTRVSDHHNSNAPAAAGESCARPADEQLDAAGAAADPSGRRRAALAGLRTAVVWDQPDRARPCRRLWATIALRSVAPGSHIVRVAYRSGDPAAATAAAAAAAATTDPSTAMAASTTEAAFTLLGPEQARRLDGAQAPLVGLTRDEAARLPAAARLTDRDAAEWGREWGVPAYPPASAAAPPAAATAAPPAAAAADTAAAPDPAARLLPAVTACVLTGFPAGARETLRNSLRSWAEAGLLSAVAATVVFVQARPPPRLAHPPLIRPNPRFYTHTHTHAQTHARAHTHTHTLTYTHVPDTFVAPLSDGATHVPDTSFYTHISDTYIAPLSDGATRTFRTLPYTHTFRTLPSLL
jgi:hypothetical protein